VSKALHVSPFSDTLKNLSHAEFTWILLNYFKDDEEEFEKTKLLCRFLNPQAASAIWDTKDKIEVTVSTPSVLYEQMSKDLKNKYTPEELKAFMNDPKHYSELDFIKSM